MRLGDLDALKEQFTEGAYTSKGVREKIDNAPTVNIKDQIAGAYNEGYICGSREAEKARPQGEWGKNGECPFCSYIRQWKDDNFCGNCGAKLQKCGEEE